LYRHIGFPSAIGLPAGQLQRRWNKAAAGCALVKVVEYMSSDGRLKAAQQAEENALLVTTLRKKERVSLVFVNREARREALWQ
jgi:hypothetical protein